MDTKIVQLVEAGDTEENSIQINDQVAPQSIPTDTLKKTEYDVEIWDNLAPNSVPAGMFRLYMSVYRRLTITGKFLDSKFTGGKWR